MSFVLYDRRGKPESFDTELEKLRAWCKEIKGRKKRKVRKGKVQYWNIPCAFDIETTSYEDKDGKHGVRYAYVLGIYGKAFVGRTWEQADRRLASVADILEVSPTNILTIYVHNLSYEFQFIRKRFRWLEVFALEERKVCYARTETGFMFRCSYILSGFSLAKVGEHLRRYKVQKRVGDLDYSLRRGSTTPLTDKEWGYIYNDGLVVRAYVQEEIENNDNSILKIPNTKTGYVRRYRSDECLYGGNKSHDKKAGVSYSSYHGRIAGLTRTPEEYTRARRAFSGGFTHGNVFNVGHVCSDVQSMDFTSSYPAVRIREKYPRTKGQLCRIESEEELFYPGRCYIRAVRFFGLQTLWKGDNYLSLSKCKAEGYQVDNGRIVKAKVVSTVRTNIDYQVMKKCYIWDKVVFGKAYKYGCGYLPTPFVKGVVKLYKDKTTLKGVKDREQEYRSAKANLNSCYGRCVTDICRDEYRYDDGDRWDTQQQDLNSRIDKYNYSKKRFLSYPWGIFVTAYARRNLWTAILELGDDYIYADTDSVKYRHPETHQAYFDEYNADVKRKLEKACSFHGISRDDVAPKTVKGVVKRIGVWDFDGRYKRFKTLGAKRYRVEEPDGERGITIAGVSKAKGMAYLKHAYGSNDNIFKAFTDELVFPASYEVDGKTYEGAGKDVHTYIDTEQSGSFIDYTGQLQKWTELSSIHLAPASYSLSITAEFFELRNAINAKPS